MYVLFAPERPGAGADVRTYMPADSLDASRVLNWKYITNTSTFNHMNEIFDTYLSIHCTTFIAI